MKNIKKLLSIVMVLAMVLSLGVQALAVDVYLPSKDGKSDYDDHTMVAYKIFEGAMSDEQMENRDDPENGNDTGLAALGVTGWANGVDKEGLLTALKAYNDKTPTPNPQFADNMTAVDAAKAISSMATSSDGGFDAVAFSRLVAQYATGSQKVTFEDLHADLGSGYWIIVDETPAEGQPENFSYSAYLLEVVGSEKRLELQDKVDIPGVDKKVNGEDAVLAGMDKPVTFEITATLPSDYAKYDKYELAFVDEMSKGLDLVSGSFTITYYHDDVAVEPSTKLEVGTADTNVKTDTVSGGDHDGWTSIYYKIADLKVTDPALKAGDKIVLTYQATLNENAVTREFNDAHLTYTNKPNSDGTGTTRTVEVTVVTFTVKGNKTDGTDPLEGAGFTLLKELEPQPTSDEGVKVCTKWEEVKATTAGDTVKYNDKYYLNWQGEKTSDKDGKFGFDSLGEGNYLLVETTVPEGYNRAEDVPFSVKQEEVDGKVMANAYDKNGDPLGSSIDLGTKSNPEGEIPADVINDDGLQLPETGGIGTTIFYAIGAILVVGAVILLVTRKRVSGASK